jgi:hypothetical protein
MWRRQRQCCILSLLFLQVGRLLHKACCSVMAGMAPDEFIVVTALKQLGYVRSIQRVEVKPHMRYLPGCLLNSYPTFVVFPAESSPHPVLWTELEKKVHCQVRTGDTKGGWSHACGPVLVRQSPL